MKKIFTLLFTTAMLSTAFAQYGQRDGGRDNRDNNVYASNDKFGNNHHDRDFGSYVFSAREKNMQIGQINREYDYKIQSVKSRPYMAWFQKKRQINDLELQRDAEIRQVMNKFNSPKNKFGDYGRNEQRRW